jgi:hypothetical protein
MNDEQKPILFVVGGVLLMVAGAVLVWMTR